MTAMFQLYDIWAKTSYIPMRWWCPLCTR